MIYHFKGVTLLDIENMGQDEAMEQSGRSWEIEDVYQYLYGWAICYDEPLNAMFYSDITSPHYLGDQWKTWKKEHYVGHKDLRERALKDSLTRSYLKRFGLLPEDDAEAEAEAEA